MNVSITNLKLYYKNISYSDYQIKSLLIKALYHNISFGFQDGSVADSVAMSTLVII